VVAYERMLNSFKLICQQQQFHLQIPRLFCTETDMVANGEASAEREKKMLHCTTLLLIMIQANTIIVLAILKICSFDNRNNNVSRHG
jgi:hypothetical protein